MGKFVLREILLLVWLICGVVVSILYGDNIITYAAGVIVGITSMQVRYRFN